MIPIPFNMLEKKPDIRALILVVEDEALLRMMLVDVLHEAGFKVMEAAHADEALHILAAAPGVQVVVTDVEMTRGRIDRILVFWSPRDALPPHPGTCRRALISSRSPFVLKNCSS